MAIVIALAAVVLLQGPPSKGQAADPLVRVWTRYQAFDNSNVYYAITADYEVRQFDSSATVGCQSEGGGPWWGEGRSVEVTGNELTTRIVGRCKSGKGFSFNVGLTYQADDTVLLSFGGVFERVVGFDPETFVDGGDKLKTLPTEFWALLGLLTDDPNELRARTTELENQVAALVTQMADMQATLAPVSYDLPSNTLTVQANINLNSPSGDYTTRIDDNRILLKGPNVFHALEVRGTQVNFGGSTGSAPLTYDKAINYLTMKANITMSSSNEASLLEVLNTRILLDGPGASYFRMLNNSVVMTGQKVYLGGLTTSGCPENARQSDPIVGAGVLGPVFGTIVDGSNKVFSC